MPYSARATTTCKFKAVAFDAFSIFDPRPIGELLEEVFPDKGSALGILWRTKLFEYQWLRALSEHYADFEQTAEDGLVSAARSMKLDISPAVRTKLLSAYSRLQVWPDVPSALRLLKDAGAQLAFLSNMTEQMLSDGIKNNHLQDLFDHVLSTDQIKTYKPDLRAYRMAVDVLGLKREQILFVPYAPWDAAGGKWFGFPTFWLNRTNSSPEELGVSVDATGVDLRSLTEFVLV